MRRKPVFLPLLIDCPLWWWIALLFPSCPPSLYSYSLPCSFIVLLTRKRVYLSTSFQPQPFNSLWPKEYKQVLQAGAWNVLAQLSFFRFAVHRHEHYVLWRASCCKRKDMWGKPLNQTQLSPGYTSQLSQMSEWKYMIIVLSHWTLRWFVLQ